MSWQKGARISHQHSTYMLALKLATRTHFSVEEATSLLTMHGKILEQGALDLLRFREVIHACFDLYEELMLDRIFAAFDSDNNGLVDAVEWVLGCSTLIRGQPDELLDFCFYVYNINGDGALDREELQHYLRKSIFAVPNVLPQEDVEESLRDIVELCMKKLDKDRDGQITFRDFEIACLRDPLLIQALGPCIPQPESLTAFLACFTENCRSYTESYGGVWDKEVGRTFPNRKYLQNVNSMKSMTSLSDTTDKSIEAENDAYNSRKIIYNVTKSGPTPIINNNNNRAKRRQSRKKVMR